MTISKKSVDLQWLGLREDSRKTYFRLVPPSWNLPVLMHNSDF